MLSSIEVSPNETRLRRPVQNYAEQARIVTAALPQIGISGDATGVAEMIDERRIDVDREEMRPSGPERFNISPVIAPVPGPSSTSVRARKTIGSEGRWR